MDMNVNTETKPEVYDCTYTFSTEEQMEVKKILEKYLPQDEDKMKELRRLDRSVARHGITAALLLVLAGGVMHRFGIQYILNESGAMFFLGIVAAVMGVALILSAYPVYRMITKKLRTKLAPQIISLCRELLK